MCVLRLHVECDRKGRLEFDVCAHFETRTYYWKSLLAFRASFHATNGGFRVRLHLGRRIVRFLFIVIAAIRAISFSLPFRGRFCPSSWLCFSNSVLLTWDGSMGNFIGIVFIKIFRIVVVTIALLIGVTTSRAVWSQWAHLALRRVRRCGSCRIATRRTRYRGV